ncbi:hypothetical protein ACWEOH_03520 [Agromyces sp. NPDC004153]
MLHPDARAERPTSLRDDGSRELRDAIVSGRQRSWPTTGSTRSPCGRARTRCCSNWSTLGRLLHLEADDDDHEAVDDVNAGEPAASVTPTP